MPSGSWNETHTTYEGALYLPKASAYYAYDASKFDIGASEVHKGVLARYLMSEREAFWQWDEPS